MLEQKPRWTKATVAAALLVLGSLVLAASGVYISLDRQLTALESSLLQAFSLVAGLAGSYLFGLVSAEASARQIIKPHARSAFRRVVSLYEGLGSLAKQIERAKSVEVTESHVTSYDVIQAIVIQQISTVDDALDDWRDIVPEEVQELHERLKNGEPLGGGAK